MKKQIIITIVVAVVSFVIGIWFEHSASQQALDEIIQISQEACDARIKTIKYTCKR